jgi:CO/xanthine dehydrogenase Mo-binding subunit
MAITRRDFLKVSFVAGSALVVSIYFEGCQKLPSPQYTPTPTGLPLPETTPAITPTLQPEDTPSSEPAWLTPNVFVKIGSDGLVTITVHRSEMGQGVRTALPMILADELGADWNLVRVEQALGDPAYGSQETGGSQSVQSSYNTLRSAGSLARQILVNAAAQTWGVDPKDCYTQDSLVIHRPTGQQLPFGGLVALAATLPVPPRAELSFKDPAEFRIIGTNLGRVDNTAILTGAAVYGMDVRLPGMLVATVARCPVIGGKVASYDDSATRQVAGVRQVLPIQNGLAVVADETYQALRGKGLLKITWDEGKNASLNSADLEQDLLDRMSQATPSPGELVQYYTMPHFAHATLEPMNCVADVRADGCELWVPTQNPQAVRSNVLSQLHLSADQVKVHVPMIGGGFGRRLENGPRGLAPTTDYVREAVEISQAIHAPVQLVWTRQDDFEHDMYQPLSVTRVSARLDDIKTLSVRHSDASSAIPVGYWRSVTNPPDAFARESFLDEYALATGVDAVELRRTFLNPRAQAVVDKAAEMASWGSSLPAGTARGLAYFATWDVTHVAQVAEVTVNGTEIRVPRVFCAVDCGLVINPDMVVAQMEGGIVFGLTATLKRYIEIINGAAQQTSFADYPLLRFDEMPQVEVYIMPSNERPTGIGEMGNPPIAPAVANAVFALTGQRLRRLPLRLAS